MYKPSPSSWLKILGRCTLMAIIWLMLLLGMYEAHHASQQDHDGDEELRRLALYGILMRVNR